MNTLKFSKGQTKMVAHRGVSGLETENTASAFVAAGNRSYYGIETDVHVTADGEFIIIHDNTTGRVSNIDIPVEGSDFNSLRSLQLYDKSGELNRKDLILPSLKEYVLICRHYEKVAVLELKNKMNKSDILRIVQTIEECDYLEQTIFISFDFSNLVALKEEYPSQAAQYLLGEYKDLEELIADLRKYKLDLDAYHAVIDKEIVDKLHAAGIKINVWTVDEPERAEELAQMGVDYITSNILE